MHVALNAVETKTFESPLCVLNCIKTKLLLGSVSLTVLVCRLQGFCSHSQSLSHVSDIREVRSKCIEEIRKGRFGVETLKDSHVNIHTHLVPCS